MSETDLGEAPAGAPGSSPSGLNRVAQALRERWTGRDCFIVGVTGAVASGKSTLSAALRAELEAWPERPAVELVCTDGFLHPNQALDALGLTARKGFPESYDTDALRRALESVRLGPAVFPAYSHVAYDVDPALARRIDRPDVLIIEGLSLDLGGETAGDRLVDVLIYLDAEEQDIEHWFVQRFLGLWQAAEHDPTSFYARFRGLDREQVARVARTVWEQVNLPNLRDHIVKARGRADIIVRKRLDHGIDAVTGAAQP